MERTIKSLYAKRTTPDGCEVRWDGKYTVVKLYPNSEIVIDGDFRQEFMEGKDRAELLQTYIDFGHNLKMSEACDETI